MVGGVASRNFKKLIKMKTLIDNRINNTIELREGRQISFDSSAIGSPINVGGKWGTVINEGVVVDSMPYDKNRWMGVTSHKEVMAEMKRRQSGF